MATVCSRRTEEKRERERERHTHIHIHIHTQRERKEKEKERIKEVTRVKRRRKSETTDCMIWPMDQYNMACVFSSFSLLETLLLSQAMALQRRGWHWIPECKEKRYHQDTRKRKETRERERGREKERKREREKEKEKEREQSNRPIGYCFSYLKAIR